VIFGKKVTVDSAQGLYLIVSDIEAARDDLLRRGVEVSEVFHGATGAYDGPDEPYLFGSSDGCKISPRRLPNWICGGRQ
jgi:hypothetical protein